MKIGIMGGGTLYPVPFTSLLYPHDMKKTIENSFCVCFQNIPSPIIRGGCRQGNVTMVGRLTCKLHFLPHTFFTNYKSVISSTFSFTAYFHFSQSSCHKYITFYFLSLGKIYSCFNILYDTGGMERINT